MRHAATSMLLLAFTALGILAVADPQSVALTVIAAAAIIVATLAALRATPPHAVAGALQRARGEIDPSSFVAQSHPDAAGHARPRAPGADA